MSAIRSPSILAPRRESSIYSSRRFRLSGRVGQQGMADVVLYVTLARTGHTRANSKQVLEASQYR